MILEIHCDVDICFCLGTYADLKDVRAELGKSQVYMGDGYKTMMEAMNKEQWSRDLSAEWHFVAHSECALCAFALSWAYLCP